VQVDLGRALDGRRRRKFVYAATERDAIAELKKLHARTVGGQVIASSTPTVGSYLNDWFATNKEEWRPSTRRGYRSAIDNHLIPAFGPRRLESLTPLLIQKWITTHKDQHGARRRVEVALSVLSSACSDAMRLQLIASNPVEFTTTPKRTKKPILSYDVEQASAFVTAASTHRLGALFSVAIACGLRQGEAMGLRWDDVNLETGEIAIEQQLQRDDDGNLVSAPTKSEKSKRALLLPPSCLETLKRHRTQQLEERLKCGARWTDTGYVFTTYRIPGKKSTSTRLIGQPLQPRNVTRVLDAIVKAANLPHIGFHALRHSAASILIAQGVDLARVSQLLGHSEMRLTANTYGHLLKQTAETAAQHMDVLFQNRRGKA
jgi:integrase